MIDAKFARANSNIIRGWRLNVVSARVFVAAWPAVHTHPAQTPRVRHRRRVRTLSNIWAKRDGELPAGGGAPPGPRVDRSMHVRRSRPAHRRSTVGGGMACGTDGVRGPVRQAVRGSCTDSTSL